MNQYTVTYFPPSAPQQAVPTPPVVLNVTASTFVYEDAVLIFVDESDPHIQVYKQTIPLELMPIVQNLGPVAT